MVGTSTLGTGQIPCVDGFAGEYPCENYDLLSVRTLEELGGGANGNDCWGWVDADSQREFVLYGRSNGLSIVEVTYPDNFTGQMLRYSEQFSFLPDVN